MIRKPGMKAAEGVAGQRKWGAEMRLLHETAAKANMRVDDNQGEGHCGPYAVLRALEVHNPALHAYFFEGMTLKARVFNLRRMTASEMTRDWQRYYSASVEGQWNDYIDGIKDGNEWFNHLALQATANVLEMITDVYETNTGYKNVRLFPFSKDGRKIRNPSHGRLNIGHVGQRHFVAIVP